MNTETRARYWLTHRQSELDALTNQDLWRSGQTFACAVEKFVIRRLALRPTRMWVASHDANGDDGVRYEIKSRIAGCREPFDLKTSAFDRLVVCHWTRRRDPRGSFVIHVDCKLVEAAEIKTRRLNALLNGTAVAFEGALTLDRPASRGVGPSRTTPVPCETNAGPASALYPATTPTSRSV